jgi:hypothetical protein
MFCRYTFCVIIRSVIIRFVIIRSIVRRFCHRTNTAQSYHNHGQIIPDLSLTSPDCRLAIFSPFLAIDVQLPIVQKESVNHHLRLKHSLYPGRNSRHNFQQ